MTNNLEVNTIQIAQWRLIKDSDVELIDTTVKSGNKAFSPSWDMVKAYKDGLLSEDDYTILYNQLMDKSCVANKQEWLNLINKNKVAIACYCKPDVFCHRHLLVNAIEIFAEEHERTVILKGEIRKTT